MGHSHDHGAAALTPLPATADSATRERYRQTLRVTLIGSAFDLLLGVAKIICGFIASSTALIADGVHSLSDLFTDFIVIYAAKHAHREADAEHPYGHARIETVATVALGVTLFAVALGITWDAVSRLFHPEDLWHPGALALVVAGVSIVVKEALYHYSMTIARKYRSNMLKANAWHSRTDAISSVVVVVGVAGAMAGLDYLDAIAAIGVAIMIAKIAWDLVWHSVQELIDTALDAEQVQTIRDLIADTDGVLSVHSLRTRRMGSNALVDVHIQVEPRLSVSEGHYISERVRHRLLAQIDDVTDVIVHIDPEDDELAPLSAGLPPRSKVLASLRELWKDVPASGAITEVRLHYLDGRLHVEVMLPVTSLAGLDQAEAVAARFARLADTRDDIAEIRACFCPGCTE